MRILPIICVALCIYGSAVQADIEAGQVAGKTLVAGKSTFVAGTDGSLGGTTDKGETLAGTWQVKSGQWCRTITSPERLAGSVCQPASIKGKTLTLSRADGSTISFKMK